MSSFRQLNVNFGDLFDADQNGDGPVANFLRGPNGQPLRYAHIQYGSKRADVGYRQNGQDVSNLWAAKGTAQYTLPFNGQGVSAHVAARTNQSGTISASAGIYLAPDGTYTGSGSTTGGSSSSPLTGRWIPVGANPADYEIAMEIVGLTWGISATIGTTFVTTPGWQNGASQFGFQARIQQSAPARSAYFNEGRARINVYVRRVGASAFSTSYITCSVSCTGWV